MIIGTNNNKTLISIESSEFKDAILANELDMITLTASYNKGTPVIKNIFIPVPTIWSCPNIPISNYCVIKQVYVKNIATQQRFPLLLQPHVVNSLYAVDILLLKLEAAIDNLGLGAIPFTYTVVGGTFTLSIQGLPSTMCMDTLEYEISAITTTLLFTRAIGGILTGDLIYISPDFFGLTEFIEGIYEIELTLHYKLKYLAQFSNCYFLDLTMKCRLGLPENTGCGLNSLQIQYLMMHYSLTQASNCQCDCNKMHTIYQFLNANLPSTFNTVNCGCS